MNKWVLVVLALLFLSGIILSLVFSLKLGLHAGFNWQYLLLGVCILGFVFSFFALTGEFLPGPKKNVNNNNNVTTP